MKKIIYTLTTATALLLLTGCFKNSDTQSAPNTGTTTQNSAKATLSGKITDMNDSAVSGATVTVGAVTVTTDANGNYTLTGIDPAQRVTLKVTHPDYLANSKVVPTKAGKPTSEDIKLDRPRATLTFSAQTGGTLTQASPLGEANVTLPADGFVDANGNPYTGDVTVSMAYYPITTQSGRAAFPGTFEGKDGNNTFPIQSYGFMNVELKDPQGNPLNLAPGFSATLRYPADPNLPNPATTPLWYYDAAQGYWIEEGSATYNNGFYTGTVTHFTSWNLDAKGPLAKLQGCVVDSNGNKVVNAMVQFRSANWDSYIRPTDENGDISVYNILAESPLTFSAFTKIGNDYYYGEYPSALYLSEGEDRNLPQCLELQKQGTLPDTITVRGHYTSGGGAVAKILGVTTQGGGNTIDITDAITGDVVATAQPDANGDFSVTFQVTDALVYKVGYYLATIILQPHKTLYDVGDISAGRD